MRIYKLRGIGHSDPGFPFDHNHANLRLEARSAFFNEDSSKEDLKNKIIAGFVRRSILLARWRLIGTTIDSRPTWCKKQAGFCL